MFNYTFPVYVAKNKITYRDKERLFYITVQLSELFHKHFLKDLNNLQTLVEQYFTLKYDDEYTGDSFILVEHPIYKNKTIYNIFNDFKTRIDSAYVLKTNVLNYKESKFNYKSSFAELSDSVNIQDLYFLTFASTTSLSSTNIPIVDTSFFRLQNSVSTYPETKSYLNANDRISYQAETNVWFDNHKYYRTIPVGISETSYSLEYFDGAELYIKGLEVDDVCQITITPGINNSSFITIGSNTSYNNIHLIYSSALTTWLLLGTS